MTGKPAPQLTLARARAMMIDLLTGFSSNGFQQKLDVLVKTQAYIGSNDLFHLPGRKELALTVQRNVLPQYGFDGSEEGVAQMVKTMQPLLATDNTLAELSRTIRQKLRMCEEAKGAMGEICSSDEELVDGKKHIRLEKAVALLNALLAHYSDPEFQMKLRKLMRKDLDAKTLRQSRKRLILDVHMVVLPKYGFAASDVGVKDMKEAFEEWKCDKEVQNLSRAIDEQIVVCMSNSIAEREGNGQGKETSYPRARAATAQVNCTHDAIEESSLRPRAASDETMMRQVSECTVASEVTQSSKMDEGAEPITKEETVQMLQELLTGFGSEDFQWKLSVLKQGQRSAGFGLDGIEELALRVQKKVLPRYGFKGTRRGVAAMIHECSRYAQDVEVAGLHNQINDKLGMDAVARQRFWKRLGKAGLRA